MKKLLFLVAVLYSFSGFAQQAIETIDNINLESIAPHTISKYWLILAKDEFSNPITVPIIIAKGSQSHPVLGLTAAIHGNELNGIKVIQNLIEAIDINNLNGIIIAVPGLNSMGISQNTREFIDLEDLNRIFPGKEHGNESEQYVWQINKKILSKIDYLIDMHTASFGRLNSLYVRGDLSNEKIKKMTLLQDADIVLNSKGPSAGANSASARTMRAEAMLKGIPTITVEYGNPQVYQDDMIKRGLNGIKNIMAWLEMYNYPLQTFDEAVQCKKSYWIYLDQGGFLEVPVDLNQMIKKGDVIGILRNPFGDIIKTYTSPEDGIVIGKSSNPANKSGGRIIHLGILED